jgi:hypothetical protein
MALPVPDLACSLSVLSASAMSSPTALGGLQLAEQVGVKFARPGPVAHFRQAAVVHFNQDGVVRRLAQRALAECNIIKPVVQPLQRAASTSSKTTAPASSGAVVAMASCGQELDGSTGMVSVAG